MSCSIRRFFAVIIALALLRPSAVLAGAGSPPAPAPASPAAAVPAVNLLANPGFEGGAAGWTHMGGQNWGAFDVVTSPVHGGAKAATLPVLGPAGSGPAGSKVFGVVQEIRLDEMPGGFPDTLSGWYRVDRWSKADPATFLYLQAVVIVWGDPRTSRLVPGTAGMTNYQIRFVLAGTGSPPFTLTNARFEFLSRDQPPLAEWVRFEIPVRRKFQELWGVVPDGYQFLRVLIEARWDSRPAGSAVDAAVTYDDLFFGYGAPPHAAAPPAR